MEKRGEILNTKTQRNEGTKKHFLRVPPSLRVPILFLAV
jgi:hypothetical protein